MRITLRNLAIYLIAFSFILFACQKDDLMTQGTHEVDDDLNTAIALVDEYLSTTKGRLDSDRVSITVLRYEGKKLFYQTYVNGEMKYKEVTEETVTAEASPGEYVFWYGGMGLEDLDEIDFDDISEDYLEKDADEIYQDRLWSILIPQDIDKKTDYLKYDIVYQFNGNSGPVIRLDPKIRIVGEGADDGEPSN